MVSTLSEPLTINVFFTRNLPPPHNQTERYLRDLLEEYAIRANKYFNYRFYDVSFEGEAGERGAMENQKTGEKAMAFIRFRFRLSNRMRSNSKELTWGWY